MSITAACVSRLKLRSLTTQLLGFPLESIFMVWLWQWPVSGSFHSETGSIGIGNYIPGLGCCKTVLDSGTMLSWKHGLGWKCIMLNWGQSLFIDPSSLPHVSLEHLGYCCDSVIIPTMKWCCESMLAWYYWYYSIPINCKVLFSLFSLCVSPWLWWRTVMSWGYLHSALWLAIRLSEFLRGDDLLRR